MSTKIKRLYLIIGLLSCVIVVMMIAHPRANDHTISVITKKKEVGNDTRNVSTMLVKNGTQWFIQTTCKILKTN